MNILTSFMVVLLGRFTVKGAISHAISGNAKRHSFMGVHIYCTDDELNLVEDALRDVADFYGMRWAEYKGCLQMIVLNKPVHSHVCIPQKVSIIQSGDRSRMSSITHLAGWLIADFERIRFFSDNSFRMIIWKKEIPDLASESALSMRKKYLAGQKEGGA